MAESDRHGDEVTAVARELWGAEAEDALVALREVGGTITAERLAELQERADWNRRLRDRRLQPARRVCLGPLPPRGHRFDSEHAGHRICARCRAHLAALYGEFDGFQESA